MQKSYSSNSKSKLLFICSIFLLLSACASVTEESVSADNKKVYGIDCSGKMIPMSYCYEKATKLCPSGYKIVKNDALAPLEYEPPVTANIIGSQIAYSIPGVKKGITIECK